MRWRWCWLLLILCAVLRAGEDSPKARVERGQELAGRGEHAAAIEQYDAATRLDAAYAPAYAWKALSLTALRQLDAADDLIERALKLKADEFTLLTIAGRIKVTEGKIDEGRERYEKAAALSPKDAGSIYADLAGALAERKDEKLAPQVEAALKKACAAEPPSMEALFTLGQMHIGAGRAEGKPYLQRFVELQLKLPKEKQDARKIKLARQMIRAVDILNSTK